MHRKAKRAPVTATVIADIALEATKAGITLERSLQICCARGWQTFRADWHTNSGQRPAARPTPPSSEHFAAVDYGRNRSNGDGPTGASHISALAQAGYYLANDISNTSDCWSSELAKNGVRMQ